MTRLARILVFLTLCISATVPQIVNAQIQKGIPSDGRDFYLGYIPPTITCGPPWNFIHVYALITSYYDNSVEVSYFDPGGVEIPGATVALKHQNSVQVELQVGKMYPGSIPTKPAEDIMNGEVAYYGACHIHAKAPVNVQYYSTGPNSGGMYLALPTAALGTNYVVASLACNPGVGAALARHFTCTTDLSSSVFQIIAVKDNTHVTIIPNGTTRRGHIGVNSGRNSVGIPAPYGITLQRGQVYMVKGENDDPDNDMSGSTVTSDQPIGVLGANESAYNGQTQFASNFGDQRDFTIEQMVPVDYWTVDGHVSMPFFDSPSRVDNDASNGDEYRIYTSDKATPVNFNIDKKGASQRIVSPYDSPPVEFDNIEDAIECRSLADTKIFVEQYDYRQQNNAEPYTAPSQMNVVPTSRWRKSFLWMVPDDANQVHKKHYINVIAQRSQWAKQAIKIARNGGSLAPIGSLTSAGNTANIPGHPDLQGRRFEIYPGSYFVKADSPLVVYQYGMLGLDPDFDLGDNDDDDYYFSYAAPCGQSFGIDGSYSPHMLVDTLCSSWNIKLFDTSFLDRGLSQIELLNDPYGVFVRKPGSDSGYVSKNVRLNPENLVIVPGDTVVKFAVDVLNPLQDAEGFLWALNVAGNDTIVHLLYKAPKLSIAPTGAEFLGVPIATDTCTHFVFKNLNKPGGQSYQVKDTKFLVGDGTFRVTSTVPPIPCALKPGDSVEIYVCFNTKDAGVVHADTLLVETDCPKAVVPLIGVTQYPLIFATDHDFGTLIVGETKCATVNVKNQGKAAMILTKQWLLHDVSHFSFPDSNKLPITLQPGQSIDLQFCYTPDKVACDSSWTDWGTNIPPPFTHLNKDYSTLKGCAIAPDIRWDRPTQVVETVCDTVRNFRVYLWNKGTADIQVDSIRFRGPNIAEYKILDCKQNHENPTNGFTLKAGDTTTWVDVRFTPNMNLPLPQRYADRFGDSLIAFDIKHFNPVILWNANVKHAELAVSRTSIDYGSWLPGTSVTQAFVITNPGNYPLLIDTISSNDPNFVITGKSAKVGDLVQPGGTDTVWVTATINSSGTITGEIYVDGSTRCDDPERVPLTMSAALVKVQNTGNYFDSVYTCKDNTNTTWAVANGSQPARLIKVEILDSAGYPGMSGDWKFANDNSASKDTSIVFAAKSTDTAFFRLRFTPAVTGDRVAVIRYTWDSTVDKSSKPWTDTRPLTGVGIISPTILSALKSDGTKYTAKTEETWSLPLHIDQSMISRADAKRMTFDITYRRDLFNYVPQAKPSPGYVLISDGVETPAGPLDVKRTFEVKTLGGAWTSAEVFATLNFQLVIARDTTSDFIISNQHWYDSKDQEICYIPTQLIPAKFSPIDFCGNGEIRKFMQTGNVIFDITSLKPNPAQSKAVLTYGVHQDGAPITVEIFNSIGDKVKTIVDHQTRAVGSHAEAIQLGDLPNGIYTVRVTGPDRSASTRMVVTH